MKRYLLCTILLGNLTSGMENEAAKFDLFKKKEADNDYLNHGLSSGSMPVAPAAAELTFDQIPQMTQEQICLYREKILAQEGKISIFLQSQLDERLEVIAIDKRVFVREKEAAISARTATKIQFKEQEIPAPFTKDNFEDVMVWDEDFPGTKGAQPLSALPIGKDAISTPVNLEASPLQHVKPIKEDGILQGVDRSSPQSPAPEMQDLLNSGELTDPETPRPSMICIMNEPITPDTSKDAALAEKLSLENQTAGDLDTPHLPVEPIARKASTQDLKVIYLEDETPGGPEGQANPIVQDLQYSQQDPQGLNAVQKTLLVAGVIAAAYTGTEIVLAYKSISERQWNENSGFVKKIKLVLGKTWQNVKSRPSQLRHLAKQVPTAGASVIAKMKSKAKAA